ncbi:MAG: DMT family transporter [Phycisphaerae bacterium]|nr:DMT family transporter [Phycisphaerae bacterium]
MTRPASLPALLFVAVLSIATAAIFIKLSSDAAPIVIAAARLSLSAILLVPIALARRDGSVRSGGRKRWGGIGLAGVFLAAHFFCWITSLRHTSVVSSVVLVTTNPIFTGIASYFLFKEPITRPLLFGILLAVVGGGTIAYADAGRDAGSVYGNVMSLLGAITASSYFLVGRSVRRDVDTLNYVLPVYSIAALLLCSGAMVLREPIAGLRTSTYVYFVLLAIVPQLIGHSIFNWALKYMSATMIAICILGEPIGATIMAAGFLDESVTGEQAVGGALILAGIFLASRGSPPAESGSDRPELAVAGSGSAGPSGRTNGD